MIDGLNVSNWSRDVFEAMREGGVSAANCTCCIWEGFDASAREIARWKRRLSENDDLLLQVFDADDIVAAKEAGKVGIILGWQNSSGFDDYLPFVGLFAELGLRVVQLTYNTANSVGCGCYEERDGGLTGFGRELVHELNRHRILIDLSHVGRQTAMDALQTSAQPVAYTHCLPAALKDHPRNKTDDELRAVAERGGFVGVTFFPSFMKRGAASTIADYLDALEYVLDLVGEQNVGIGTDFTEGHGPSFVDYITRDKGIGRRLTEFAPTMLPTDLTGVRDFPRVTEAMVDRGWSDDLIMRVLGRNWLGFLGTLWSSAGGPTGSIEPAPGSPGRLLSPERS